MMTGSDSHAVAGGLARHTPVLVRRAIHWLDVREGGLYVDATFGGGGFTREILSTAGARVIGLDRDRDAISAGAGLAAEAAGRLDLVEERFSNLSSVLSARGLAAVDGVVFDLGVSSMQLDETARGFSFRREAPLDMRMGPQGPTAADFISTAGERDLAVIIAALGEERHARSVARAIVKARAEQPITSTRMLAELVARAVPERPGSIHPATRTFQAVRMFINDELGELARGLIAAERLLKRSGRLVVISFHSLEDRMVKVFLAERSRAPAASRHRPPAPSAAAAFRLLTRRAETPDVAEIAANPRARSAKLRAAERTDAPAHAAVLETMLPPLPSLDAIVRGRP